MVDISYHVWQQIATLDFVNQVGYNASGFEAPWARCDWDPERSLHRR